MNEKIKMVTDNYDNIKDWYFVNPLSKSAQKIKEQGFAYVRNIEDDGEIADGQQDTMI